MAISLFGYHVIVMILISTKWPLLICGLLDSLLDVFSCLVNQPLMAGDVFPLIKHTSTVKEWIAMKAALLSSLCIYVSFNLIFFPSLSSLFLSARRGRSDNFGMFFHYYIFMVNNCFLSPDISAGKGNLGAVTWFSFFFLEKKNYF